MLMNMSHILNLPVLSLHVGGAVAFLNCEIVDPATLTVLGFYVDGPALDDPEVGDILDMRSAREISSLGIVVNSTEEFVEVADVLKIKRAAEKEFVPVNKKVFDENGKRLGKVYDYVVETDGFKIVDLIVRRPLIRALAYPEVFIPASEIVEVMDDRFIVRASSNKVESTEDRARKVPFTNPFREPLASTSRMKNPER